MLSNKVNNFSCRQVKLGHDNHLIINVISLASAVYNAKLL